MLISFSEVKTSQAASHSIVHILNSHLL